MGGAQLIHTADEHRLLGFQHMFLGCLLGLQNFSSPSGAGTVLAQMDNTTCLLWPTTWDQQITEMEASVFNNRGDSYCLRQVDKSFRLPGSQGEIRRGEALV